MARAKVKLNSGGMSQLLKSGEIRAALEGPAQSTAARAQSGAPRDTGEYAAGITVVDDTTDRAVKRVIATAPHSMAVEARTGNLLRSLGG